MAEGEYRLILVEDDDDPHPVSFDEHDLAVIAMHEDLIAEV